MSPTNANRDLAQSLAASGVHFDACENAVAAMTEQLGLKPIPSPNATPVPAGIVQIVRLIEVGGTFICP